MDLWKLHDKQKKLVIGLMSGTSADGIDAALTEITGCGTSTKVKQLGFVSIPFADEVRERILKVVNGHFGCTEEICLLSFLLSQKIACKKTDSALSREKTNKKKCGNSAKEPGPKYGT